MKRWSIMIKEWQQFLEGAGATIERECVVNFGNPVRENRVGTTGGILADLSHYGLLSVIGADARKFLQAQTINDVSELDGNRAQISGYCSPNGRLIATFLLFQHEEALLLRLPRPMTEAVKKRLAMYVLNARVELADASDKLTTIGYSAPDGDAVLESAIGEIPRETGDVVHQEGITIIRIVGPNPRFVLAGGIGPIKSLWTTLNVTAAPVGAFVWDRLNILAGVPIVSLATTDQFLPQMLNLDRIGGVSFRKGCYPGQEVIARVQHRGQVKRRMYLAYVGTDRIPVPGDPIYTGKDKVTGTVLMAQPAPAGGTDMLIVIPTDFFETTTLHLDNNNGPVIEYRQLPYMLTDSPSG